MSIDPVASKVGKLLRLLTSPNEGEVLGAARAIGRTLETAGADIHELAERIEGRKLSEQEMQIIYDQAYRDGKEAAEVNKGFTNTDGSTSWHDMAVEVRDKDNRRLTEREREFVLDLVRWTERREPTERQGKWLHVLYVRARRWR